MFGGGNFEGIICPHLQGMRRNAPSQPREPLVSHNWKVAVGNVDWAHPTRFVLWVIYKWKALSVEFSTVIALVIYDMLIADLGR